MVPEACKPALKIKSDFFIDAYISFKDLVDTIENYLKLRNSLRYVMSHNL